MKLTVDREDLKPEFVDTNCSLTLFEYFKKDVQIAILTVGKATFQEYDRSNYNVIYAPKN